LKSPNRSNHSTAIVFGVLGGLAMLAALFFLLRRWRKRRAERLATRRDRRASDATFMAWQVRNILGASMRTCTKCCV
jgi:LPXTG-motif cell wall-anchored protein